MKLECQYEHVIVSITESTKNVFARFCANRSTCAKFAQKWCQYSLTPEQKDSRMNICADILNNTDTDSSLLDTVITCDDKIRKCGSGQRKSDGGSEPADRSGH
ncbi:hypothetical protein NQ318_012727 [Aromia moschata]|uniref:Uncharacterized protein n=1 Tax=Aromia moschata TaxID=1265417 RepID=A0AAV8Y2Q4_9CUCU|nr:hypothetical protein NQ318_012727 [Aromia moschata]